METELPASVTLSNMLVCFEHFTINGAYITCHREQGHEGKHRMDAVGHDDGPQFFQIEWESPNKAIR